VLVPGFHKWPNMQLLGIVLAVAYFAINGSGFFPALYGGIVSLLNTGLISRHTEKQKKGGPISAQASVGMMVMSVLMRMAVVIALTLIGLLSFKFEAAELISGLVLGQVGFLIDKVKQI